MAFLVVILDKMVEGVKSDGNTQKGQESSTEETRIGADRERRKGYAAAVICDINKKSRAFCGRLHNVNDGFKTKGGMLIVY